MNTSDRIVNLRENKKITQKAFAEEIKINRSVINRIEKGTRPIRDDELKIIADFFDVSIDYLLGADEKDVKNSFELTEEQRLLISDYDSLSLEKRKDLIKYLKFLKHEEEVTSSTIPLMNGENVSENNLAV